jgi:2-amino-4-deoxychorismate synthase
MSARRQGVSSTTALKASEMTWPDHILRPDGPPFALLHRPESDRDAVDLLIGEVVTVPRLADLPLSTGPAPAGPAHDLLALVPYRQIAERGYDAVDDGTPLLALRITDQRTLTVAEVLEAVPDVSTTLRGAHFDIDDDAYAELVRRIAADEIGTGEGANFVIRRSLLANIDKYAAQPRHHELGVFGRLLRDETGAHWTFLVHTGDRTLVGASPERHITLDAGTATMNPISGTFRYPPTGPDLAATLRFLADSKETDELYMVLDEELKMMGRVCPDGGRVIGPRLRPMTRLAHTEYLIEGRTDLDVRRILRETLFAPTVTGSPLESACRVIARYEKAGRAYYAGVLALIGRDAGGGQALDSAIVIRAADIDATGSVRIDVGATLVRHSDPHAEAAETRGKAQALLTAFRPGTAPVETIATPAVPWNDPAVRRALAARNARLAPFWLQAPEDRLRPVPELLGRSALVVECEDDFTEMLGYQLRTLGLRVSVRRFDTEPLLDGHDLVVMGPGPGDPRSAADPKIAAMRRILSQTLEERRPLLAVCLGHQVLATLLGLPVGPLPAPNQGAQHAIRLRGRLEHCGFYNSFSAFATADQIGMVDLDRDPATGAVHAMRGQTFRSFQFHAESVLTRHGVTLVGETAGELLGSTASTLTTVRGKENW